MSSCIFCDIIKGISAARIIFEDNYLLAFYDVNPVAKIHALVMPKKHIESLNNLLEKDYILITKINVAIPKIAKELQLHKGFKTIINTGKAGGQKIFHLHYHIIGSNE